MPKIILGRTRTYIGLYRKVDLLSRTEKRYLWLAEVNFRNWLSIIYMYTQSFSADSKNICTTSETDSSDDEDVNDDFDSTELIQMIEMIEIQLIDG